MKGHVFLKWCLSDMTITTISTVYCASFVIIPGILDRTLPNTQDCYVQIQFSPIQYFLIQFNPIYIQPNPF